MIRLIAVAALTAVVATPAQALSPAPLHHLDGMTTQVAYACGAGRTRVGGSGHANTGNSCPKRSASESDLRDHGVRMMKQGWRHGLRRCCDG